MALGTAKFPSFSQVSCLWVSGCISAPINVPALYYLIFKDIYLDLLFTILHCFYSCSLEFFLINSFCPGSPLSKHSLDRWRSPRPTVRWFWPLFTAKVAQTIISLDSHFELGGFNFWLDALVFVITGNPLSQGAPMQETQRQSRGGIVAEVSGCCNCSTGFRLAVGVVNGSRPFQSGHWACVEKW